jgi:hypothetical protein
MYMYVYILAHVLCMSVLILLSGTRIECDKLIVAMGPWSCVAGTWYVCMCIYVVCIYVCIYVLRLDITIPMTGIQSTSVIYTDNEGIEPYTFCAEDRNGTHLEVIPRPNNDVYYVCGLGGSIYLDEIQLAEVKPQEVYPNKSRVQKCNASMSGISNTITNNGTKEPRH